VKKKKKRKVNSRKINSLFFCCFQMYAVRGGKLNLKGLGDDSSHSKKRKKHSSSSSSTKKQKPVIDNEEDDGEQDYVQ
jgi:hypothetical protein